MRHCSICARSSLMRALLVLTATPSAFACSYFVFSSCLLSSITWQQQPHAGPVHTF